MRMEANLFVFIVLEKQSECAKSNGELGEEE